MTSPHAQGLIDRVLDLCGTIWIKVRTRLCVDSPETSSDGENDDAKGGPKDMLSYSWRALRDSRSVLRTFFASAYLILVVSCYMLWWQVLTSELRLMTKSHHAATLTG